MRTDACRADGMVSNSRRFWYVAVGLCGLLALSQASCRKPGPGSEPAPASVGSAAPVPPDLSRCNRIEIRFWPSTLDFIYIRHDDGSLLSQDETEYLKSAKVIEVRDPKAVKALVQAVASSTYQEPVSGYSGERVRVAFSCYDNDEYMNSFILVRDVIETEDKQRFKPSEIPWGMLAPQIQPFRLRLACASNLRELYRDLQWYLKEQKSYPPVGEWYGAILHAYQVRGYTSNEAMMIGAIRCPSAGTGEFHYAMNPACEPGSAPETVLLFEAEPERNQHGGLELFTFDNHNPKGGLVLLNDGTVKFIRTEKELKQLRWK
jgi:hypothetical protein